MSVKAFVRNGAEIFFRRDESIEIFDKDDGMFLHIKAVEGEDEHLVDIEVVKRRCLVVALNATLDDWHKRFAHINKKTLENMIKNKVVEGLKIKENERVNDCVNCETWLKLSELRIKLVQARKRKKQVKVFILIQLERLMFQVCEVMLILC